MGKTHPACFLQTDLLKIKARHRFISIREFKSVRGCLCELRRYRQSHKLFFGWEFFFLNFLEFCQEVIDYKVAVLI